MLEDNGIMACKMLRKYICNLEFNAVKPLHAMTEGSHEALVEPGKYTEKIPEEEILKARFYPQF